MAEMDIPLDVPARINSINNSVSKSVVYTFPKSDIIPNTNGYSLLKFPYSKNTFWTNFKFSSPHTISLQMSVVLITSNGYSYNVGSKSEKKANTWYELEWPFPSIYDNGSNSGLYFKIKTGDRELKGAFKLVGFTGLFPIYQNYILLSISSSYETTYQFLFSEFEDDSTENITGTIMNIENFEYIKDTIDNAFVIKPLKYY